MSARRIESHGLDRWLLALAFLGGAGGTLALKALEAPAWAPAAFAGASIVAYASAVWTLRSARLEPEQIGDNAYYLGFVLTLCSLAWTLWSLGTVSAETAFVAEVVAGFGIALTSTVVGVAVRVFLMQFRLDLAAREREAQMAIADGLAAFRTEIAEAIRGTRYLGVEIRQTLAQHHRELARAEAGAMESAGERLGAAFEAAVAAQAARTEARDAAAARRVEAATADAAARIAALAARLDDASRARADTVEARLAEATDRAAAAAEVRLARTLARYEAALNRAAATMGASAPDPEGRPRVIEGGR